MDEPVITLYYNNGNIKFERWHNNGQLHRLDGPAFIWYYENGNIKFEQWCINGTEIKKHPKKWPLNNEQQIEMKLKYA